MTEDTQGAQEAVFSEVIQVPSRGKFYGGLLPDGMITLRVITVKEEKIMAGAKNRMTAMDRILERCMVKCPIPLKDLLITDKFYLLLSLRSISYGSDYQYEIPCAACGIKFKQTVELVKGLQVTMASDDDTEPFDVLLPVTKKTVSLRFLRGTDEADILKYVEQLGRNQTGMAEDEDPSYEFRLSKHITAIDGKELDSLQRLHFVEKLTGKDSLEMRRAIGKRETGASMGVSTRCPACGHTSDILLPITSDFFPAGVS